MSNLIDPNRSVIASGRFNGISDGSSRSWDVSTGAKMPSVSPRAAIIQDLSSQQISSCCRPDKLLADSLKEAVDTLARREDGSRNDWQGLPSLRQLAALSHGLSRPDVTSVPFNSPNDADSAPDSTQSLVSSRLSELLNEPSNDSRDLLDSAEESADSHSRISGAGDIASSRNVDESFSPSPTSLVSPQAIPYLSLSSLLSDTAASLESNDFIDRPASSSTIADNDFLPSVDIGLQKWTNGFGVEPAEYSPQGQRILPDATRGLVFPSFSAESGRNDVDSSSAAERDPLRENPSPGLDSTFNSIVANRFSPSGFPDFNSINDLGSLAGASWFQGFGGNIAPASDFNTFPGGRESQSGDGQGDLSKTNELLQQLIEEVKKGRQGFLPMSDRNSNF